MHWPSKKIAGLGASLEPDGVGFRVWAPKRGRVVVCVENEAGQELRSVELESDASGYFHGKDPLGQAGDLYRYRLDGGDRFPDPASHFQPAGVHGASMVIDHQSYRWKDDEWSRPALRDFVIYELHIGTFTEEGTFAAAGSKLPYLRDLGITAIEIMPIADFAGDRNWGYDGVCLFAPARIYGTPDDFRALVDEAHRLGLAVILDVVYNHFGPDGCYIGQYADEFFDREAVTPWGSAINFSHAEPVRHFYLSNIQYWIEAFHIDAFRLDATHTIIDASNPHILWEIGELAHRSGCYVIAEDERNEARLVTPVNEEGYGLDAVWADEFHHTVETTLLENSSYKNDFPGGVLELAENLEHGWIFRGQRFSYKGVLKGTQCAHLPFSAFVFCISNHDQIGNRAYGERLHQMISPASYRAASGLLCLTPYQPLLFMGQEWGSSSPFLFFSDHHDELGKLVSEGRLEELHTGPFRLPASEMQNVPDPQNPETFRRSKLNWAEMETPGHAETMTLYRELLRLRTMHAALRPADRAAVTVAVLPFGALAVRIKDAEGDWLMVCDLDGGHKGYLLGDAIVALPPEEAWHVVLQTNERRFGGFLNQAYDAGSGSLNCLEPVFFVFRASPL